MRVTVLRKQYLVNIPFAYYGHYFMSDLAKIKELVLENIVLAIFALITLLLLVIWQVVPSSVWDKASEVVPKRTLWALVALELAIGVLVALLLDKRRNKSEPPSAAPQKRRSAFGIYWDEDFNPQCPACETPLVMQHKDERGTEFLKCLKCKETLILKDDEGNPLELLEIKRYFKGEVKHPFWGDDP